MTTNAAGDATRITALLTTNDDVLSMFEINILTEECARRQLSPTTTSKEHLIAALSADNLRLENERATVNDSNGPAPAPQDAALTIHVRQAGDVTRFLRPYSGRPQESLQYFIRNVERAAILNQWTEDMKISMASGLLEKQAADWNDQFGCNINTWEEWTKSIHRYFQRNESQGNWRQRMAARVQNGNETLADFVSSKSALIDRTQKDFVISEEDKIQMIVDGIRSIETQDLFRMTTFKDRVEMLWKARKLDENHRRPTRRDAPNFTTTTTDENVRPTRPNANADDRTPCQPTVGDPFSHRFRNGMDKTNIRCYRCQALGHITYDCPLPDTRGRNARQTTTRNDSTNSYDLKQTTIRNDRPKTNTYDGKQTTSRNERANTENRISLCLIKTKWPGRSLTVIDAYVNEIGHTLDAFVDAGSEITLVKRGFLTSNAVIKPLTNNDGIVGLDQIVHKPTGLVDLHLRIGPINTTIQNAAVVDELPFPLIIGVDWTRQEGLTCLRSPNGDIQIMKDVPHSSRLSILTLITTPPDVTTVCAISQKDPTVPVSELTLDDDDAKKKDDDDAKKKDDDDAKKKDDNVDEKKDDDDDAKKPNDNEIHDNARNVLKDDNQVHNENAGVIRCYDDDSTPPSTEHESPSLNDETNFTLR